MLDTLKSLLEEQIKDLYSAESQLVKALPKMAKKASTESLRAAFEGHLEETRGHVERLAEIAQLLEIKPGGKTCKAMQGLIEEGKEVLEEEGADAIIDVALIAAAQRVEHYEIAAYGSTLAMAEHLKQPKIGKLLQATLDEEQGANEKLSDICSDEVLPSSEMAAQEDETESAVVQRPKRKVSSRQG